MFKLASKSSRSCLIASLVLTIGCGGGDGGGAGGSGGGAGGTVGSGGRGGTTGTAGTSGGTTGTAGTSGGTAGTAGTAGGAAGASGTTGTGGAGGGVAGASGATGTGGGAGGRGGAAAGTTGGGGTGGGAAGASGTTGAAGASGATGTGGSAGATCAGTLVATAPPVPENRVAEAFSTSAAAGGTIMDGTYHLTSLSLYTGPGGATGPTGTNRSMTSRISGSTLEVIIISGPSGGGGTTTRLTFSLTTAGSAFNVTQTCPAGGPTALAFTASGNTLTVYSPSNGSNLAEVQVFTLGNPQCTNVFPSTAPLIMLNRVAETLPVANATGGALVPGTYHLTSLTSYTGPGGATGPTGQPRSQTVRITAGSAGASTLESSAAATVGGTGQWLVFTGTPSGTSLMLTQICPTAGLIGSFPYTATASTFMLYNPSTNVLESFAKQ